LDELTEPSSFRKFVRYFLRGAVITFPVVLTVWVAWQTVAWVDSWLGIDFPGAGLLLVLLGITLIGMLATNVVTRAAIGTLDEIMARVPLVRLLYNASKDLMNAFAGEKKSFNSSVRVRIDPDKDLWILGFVTAQDLSRLGLPEHVAVYLPQSYNFAGQLILVPANQVEAISIDGSDHMTFIVSGGVAQGGGGAP
jgi:uncharacterized membrane protein